MAYNKLIKKSLDRLVTIYLKSKPSFCRNDVDDRKTGNSLCHFSKYFLMVWNTIYILEKKHTPLTLNILSRSLVPLGIQHFPRQPCTQHKLLLILYKCNDTGWWQWIINLLYTSSWLLIWSNQHFVCLLMKSDAKNMTV